MIKFAKEASKIRTPVYYDIFPCFGNENSEKYKENFRIFQGLLKKAAPSSSIVWSFDTLNDNTFSQYFPGTGYTDYIGMICLFDNPYDCIEKLSSFSNSYDVYSNVLPIIITRFGVSHYSDYDHTYKIEGAEKFIEYFYNDLCSSLEDIKAVIYADENMLNTQNTFITPCDYTISSLTELKEIFKKVTDN